MLSKCNRVNLAHIFHTSENVTLQSQSSTVLYLQIPWESTDIFLKTALVFNEHYLHPEDVITTLFSDMTRPKITRQEVSLMTSNDIFA